MVRIPPARRVGHVPWTTPASDMWRRRKRPRSKGSGCGTSRCKGEAKAAERSKATKRGRGGDAQRGLQRPVVFESTSYAVESWTSFDRQCQSELHSGLFEDRLGLVRAVKPSPPAHRCAAAGLDRPFSPSSGLLPCRNTAARGHHAMRYSIRHCPTDILTFTPTPSSA